ncbi:MAG: hypothetical protein ACI9XK_001248 [Granulosicoccus sp.]|jgi:hypothetical protein
MDADTNTNPSLRVVFREGCSDSTSRIASPAGAVTLVCQVPSERHYSIAKVEQRSTITL